jgi:hypothetical protein
VSTRRDTVVLAILAAISVLAMVAALQVLEHAQEVAVRPLEPVPQGAGPAGRVEVEVAPPPQARRAPAAGSAGS